MPKPNDNKKNIANTPIITAKTVSDDLIFLSKKFLIAKYNSTEFFIELNLLGFTASVFEFRAGLNMAFRPC